jgi:hypothetical protein
MSGSGSLPDEESEFMRCTYCDSEMKISTVKVKRPVPPGARDLGLEDDKYRWQCPECELVSDAGIWQCSCGMFTVVPEEAKNAPGLAAKLMVAEPTDTGAPAEFRCSQCVQCAECGNSLFGEEVLSLQDRRDANRVRLNWYHVACHAKRKAEMDARELERRKALEEQQNEARRRREEAEAEQARLEKERQEEVAKAEAIHRLEEQQRMEVQKREDEIRNRRIRLDQCVICGRKLKMGDKLLGRQIHKACKDKPMRMIG